MALALAALLSCVPALATAASISWPPAGSAPKDIHSYAWTAITPGLPNITNFVWVRPWTIQNIPAIVAQINALPPGRRAMILDGNLYATNYPSVITEYGVPVLHNNPGDRCRDSSGTPLNYQCIWWDQGVADVSAYFDQFFRAFRDAGGQVNLINLDTERGVGNWSIPQQQGDWDAIENDPRFVSTGIRAQLEARGPFAPSGAHLYETVAQFGPWCAFGEVCRDNYLIWNSLMSDRVAGYLNQAIYEPARAYFPNVKLADYGYYRFNPIHAIPDINGHHEHRYGSGAIVGTHQSQSMYATIGQIRFSGLPHFQPTAFNAFRYDVNRAKSMALASPTPIHPWFADRSWWGDAAFNYLIRNTDLYQESMLHTGMLGVDEFLFWNVVPPAQAPQDDAIFNRVIGEIKEVVGYQDRQPLTTGLSPWEDQFVYTGMRVGGYHVWRFTPLLESSSLAQTIISESNPVVFQVGNKQVVFAQGSIYGPSDPSSSQGAWVMQPSAAPRPEVLDCGLQTCWSAPKVSDAIVQAQLYPNPAVGGQAQTIRVIVDGKAVGGRAKFYAVSGEALANVDLGGGNLQQDGTWAFEAPTPALPSGVYVYAVEIEGSNGARWRRKGKTAVIR